MKPAAEAAVSLAVAAVIAAGLVLGTPWGPPLLPPSVLSVTCPAGQRVTAAHPRLGDCVTQPAPKRTVRGVAP